MPLYEYLCDDCGDVTETLRSMATADDAIACEHCGSKKTHRTHSVFAAASTDSASGAPGEACERCESSGGCPFRDG